MKNGDRYEGDTKNGYREGKGILWFNSGAKYEGDFIKSKFEVKRTYYWKNRDREMEII